MKNNKNIKILLPLVILIWGFIIYTLVDTFSPEQAPTQISKTSTFKPLVTKKPDTFSLSIINRDPFLGTLSNPKKKGNKKPVNVNLVDWPEISYLGLVSDEKAVTSVFVLAINGKQSLVKKGEIVGDLKVLSGSKQSIQLLFQGQTQSFLLK